MLKNLYGREINSELTKQGKINRSKEYINDSVKFATLMVIFDLIAIIFKVNGIADLNIVNNQIINILFNLIISFVVLFFVSYAIDYLVTEYKVKKNNGK